jgi:uncharacterized repeat protein (TIGR03803 family)
MKAREIQRRLARAAIQAMTSAICSAAGLLAHGQAIEVLHSFQNTDGARPGGRLIEGREGNFYGTTSGDSNHSGTVFRITANGELTTLVNFNEVLGRVSYAGLVQVSNGDFYGTTTGGNGTIFKFTPGAAFTTLVSFNAPDGRSPSPTLLAATDGSFYGTTHAGGAAGDWFGSGTVFKMTSDGALTTLVDFALHEGYAPNGGVIEGRDGNFYGTTMWGGTHGAGTVFKMTPAGELITLASFDPADGHWPQAPLVEGSDGNFYGTTAGGSPALPPSPFWDTYLGTIFRITPDGELTRLVRFDGTNGAQPARAGLILGSDGNFYGTTQSGGGNGTVYRMTPDGVLTTLVYFNRANGTDPLAGVIEGRDGHLYGTTVLGGVYNRGTVFRVVMPGPRVEFRRSGGQVILSWPANAAGFTLQSTVDLSSPEWMDSHDVPVVVNGHYTVTKEISGEIRFYRLKR